MLRSRYTFLFVGLLTIVGCGEDPSSTTVPKTPECTVSEAVNLGQGMMPKIGASGSTFGVSYSTVWNGDIKFQTVTHDGQATAPAVTLPADHSDQWPQLTSLRTFHVRGMGGAYLVTTQAIGNDPDSKNVYVLNENGSSRLPPILGIPGLTSLQVADGDQNFVAWFGWKSKQPSSPDCQDVLHLEPLTPSGNFGRYYEIYCRPLDEMRNWNPSGLALKGQTVLAGVMVNEPSYHRLSFVAGKIGGKFGTFDLGVGNESREFSINGIEATTDGLYSHWNELDIQNGGPDVKIISHLTFFNSDGQFDHEVEIPSTHHTIWNGKVFGAVDYSGNQEFITFSLISPSGKVLVTKQIPAIEVHYESWPEITAQGDDFGVVWAQRDPESANGDNLVNYVHVSCKIPQTL